jgi:tRNA-specific 2-thiouridylase
MSKQGKKVFVGLSGGVDSSVAAFLLQKQGYEVVGVFLKCFNLDGCAERDAEDARRVAEHLKISFYVFDFEEEYKRAVVGEMVKGYREGITPNPDVLCNREIKFGLFLKKALELGADYVATGHYVKLVTSNWKIENFIPRKLPTTNYQLRIASDTNKDQSYFLYTLNQEDLKHCLFPLGNYKKPQVRKIAEQVGLSTAKKKDSQGICFLGQVNLEDFLKTYIPEKPGDIVTLDGQVIGQHKGSHFYTVGQRHGFMANGLGHIVNSRKGRGNKPTPPYYVVSKDLEKNLLIVAEGDSNESLYKKEVNLVQVNFISSNHKLFATSHTPVFARVRYRQPLQEAKFSKTEKGWKLIFKSPVKFVAEGQSAVFYDRQGNMLGGGVIV